MPTFPPDVSVLRNIIFLGDIMWDSTKHRGVVRYTRRKGQSGNWSIGGLLWSISMKSC